MIQILHLIEGQPPATPWESPAAYVAARRRLLPAAEGLPLALIEIEAGGQLLPHVRAEALLYLVLTGAARMTQGEHEAALGAGDLVTVPAALIRGIANAGDGLLRLVELHPPAAPTPASGGLRWRR